MPPKKEGESSGKAEEICQKLQPDNGNSSEDSEVDELKAPSTGKTIIRLPEVNWNKFPELSLKLVAIIITDRTIKIALFPPCGAHASSTDGGGERKVAAQWSCCVKLLGDLPKYQDAIASVKGGKVKTGWANKIKNRLRT
ncbi:hypothetical protein C8J57DRAFT_1542737 [Mycena rebaudengoi]|nr:hypothetical protein C8J57DRAFT_1542737 [Mycena rebaudengoi]